MSPQDEKGRYDMTQYRAEHVGSLLRPPELLAAREAYAQGRLSRAQLSEREDRAALAAIELQRDAGIEAVAASSKLYQKERLTSTEAAFLATHAPGQYKITIMSASMGAGLWHPGVSEQAYLTPQELLEDVMRLQIAEIEGLLDQGVTWIQLDSLSYNWVIDEELSAAFAAATGIPPAVMLEMTIGVDQAIVRATKAKNPNATVAMHFCRGNNRSAWMAKGSYEPVAERLFGEVGVDRFLLEYDTERAGGFEPLRFVPTGTTVVLGLISSKVPTLESQDDLRRRIDEAAKYVPLENLAISPQCGFASTAS